MITRQVAADAGLSSRLGRIEELAGNAVSSLDGEYYCAAFQILTQIEAEAEAARKLVERAAKRRKS